MVQLNFEGNSSGIYALLKIPGAVPRAEGRGPFRAEDLDSFQVLDVVIALWDGSRTVPTVNSLSEDYSQRLSVGGHGMPWPYEARERIKLPWSSNDV